ncbi:M56 family metallopeptidase [Saccharothrix variisporea]|uniref:Zn-dependent protease with chaperone function n=1 Tax=Saccharothrix variisporea TaxID=543527 RepID=A0A495XN08_9PSEU|nr:M56 family metallopeptidase [Saccharothrix variisporea]RKT74585.1 Zn-dependent protease with chaperone function [Saccharothrix variisporea]
MTVAAALLITAALVGVLAPRPLLRLAARDVDPTVALAAWLASAVGVVVAAALAVTLLLVPDHGTHALGRLHQCWSSLGHGMTPGVEAAGGLLGLGLVAALLARLVVVSTRAARRRARTRRTQLATLRVAARQESGTPTTLWLDHDAPLAFTLAGSPGVVVATEGLHRHLTDDQVAAVLTHERAHLAGRHHLLVAAGEAIATVLPVLPLFRHAPAAVKALVELAADAAAVRTCGAEAVRSALLRVSQHGTPGTALAMGQDAVEVRLERLTRAGRRRSALVSRVSCVAACTTAVALPTVAGLGGLLALISIGCL